MNKATLTSFKSWPSFMLIGLLLSDIDHPPYFLYRIICDPLLNLPEKPLVIFLPRIKRKRSKEYFVVILAVKESFERFSCLEFIFEKANIGKPAYKMKNINKDFRRHFNTCLRE